MKTLFGSRVGQLCVLGFILLMACVGLDVAHRRATRTRAQQPPATFARPSAPAVPSTTAPRPTPAVPSSTAAASAAASPSALPGWTSVAKDAAYLERYYALDRRTREDQDRQGVGVTRRKNARTPSDAGHLTPAAPASADLLPAPPPLDRVTLRLSGHPPPDELTTSPAPASPATETVATASAPTMRPADVAPSEAGPDDAPAPGAAPPHRFNPYGGVLKCQLVFTIDSANEEAPLVGLVMEPVYNNGVLVIPAGAELHGMARPDRLRDRILSAQDWVLVFPRESGRVSGRQLNVRGVALDREADADGLTWGLTDGSLGLQGQIVRSLDGAEIKRFVATFLSESAVALQQRQTDDRGHDSVKATPQNALLQGVAADLDQVAKDVAQEIAQHGVFIRVPAGHQFYFYPMQTIDADRAGISSDLATLK